MTRRQRHPHRSRAAPPTTTGQQPRVPRRSIPSTLLQAQKVDDEIVVKDPDGVSHVVRVPAGPRGSAIPATFDVSVPFEKDGWSDRFNEFRLGRARAVGPFSLSITIQLGVRARRRVPLDVTSVATKGA